MTYIAYLMLQVLYAALAAWDIQMATDAYKDGSKGRMIFLLTLAIYFIAETVRLAIKLESL